MKTDEKHAFFRFFKQLCVKRGYRYLTRSSRSSNYIEVMNGSKVYLFRFSDHEPTSDISWQPDFDVRDERSFRAAKKFIKAECKRNK